MNTQKPEPKVVKDRFGMVDIDIHSIFPTIQGEGPDAGTPAIFIRMAGCNLQCPACDTDYTSRRLSYDVRDVLDVVNSLDEDKVNTDLVVITGGEPLRQDISLLVESLLKEDYWVQIETNGTFYRSLPYRNQRLSIVCSPKLYIHPKLASEVDAWKYVVRHGEIDENDGLPSKGMLGLVKPPPRPLNFFWQVPIFIQPLDEGDEERNRLNLQAAVECCMKFGYRLSVQSHKIASLP